MNNDFMRLCQTLNLTSAEVIRYLIEEELKVWKPIWDEKETEKQEMSGQIAAIQETNVTYEKTKGNQKVTNHQPEKKLTQNKPLYAQWRVDGKMPCPICETWQKNLVVHLKKHKTTKQKVFSDPKYAEIATQMAKDALEK
jgi:hypothetical protein